MARLSRVSLFGIRNLQRQVVDLGSDIIVVTGDNRQGKTNFLEAVYIGISGRSFRTSKLRDVIAYGKSAGWVQIELSDGTSLKSVLTLRGEKASVSFFMNDKKIPLKDNPFRMRVFPVLGSDIVDLHRKSVLTKKVLQFALRFDDRLRELYGAYLSLRRKRRKLLRDGGDKRLLVIIDSKLGKVVGPLEREMKRLSLKVDRVLRGKLEGVISDGDMVLSYTPRGDSNRIGYFQWEIAQPMLTLGTKMLLLMYLLEGLADVYQMRDRMYLFWDDVGFELDKLTLRMLLQKLALRFQIFWAIPWIPEDVLPTGVETKVFRVFDGRLTAL